MTGTPVRKEPVDRKETGGRRRNVLLMAGFTVLVILAVGTFAVLTAMSDDFTPNDRGLLPVGSRAPGFTTETVNGGSVSLSDTRGAEATMLVFFATWCPHCNEEAPVLSELQDEYEDLRVVMLGVDEEDDAAQVREFVDRYQIEGPAAYDPSLGPVYQASGYPTIYVINGSGEIVAAHSGEVPKDVLESWIEEALPGGS